MKDRRLRDRSGGVTLSLFNPLMRIIDAWLQKNRRAEVPVRSQARTLMARVPTSLVPTDWRSWSFHTIG
jgi:hypothetical protein